MIPQVVISSHSSYENPAFKSLTAFSKIGKTDADKNIWLFDDWKAFVLFTIVTMFELVAMIFKFSSEWFAFAVNWCKDTIAIYMRKYLHQLFLK